MTGGEGLRADVRVRRGDFVLDAAVELEHGAVLVVLGPNGSGKSTLLEALAGQLRPESGRVAMGGRVLSDGATFVPPSRRGVGFLGQDPLLFPHLSVLENVAFGLRANGMHRRAARALAAEWLGRVGLTAFEGHKPGALSGGQQQRAALARALAAEPALLLLDEPLAALDVEAAALMRTLLRDHVAQTGVTAVIVTHNIADAIVLADRAAIMQNGRIVDHGQLARVLGEPASRFTASLVGLNLLTGVVAPDGSIDTGDGRRFTGNGGPFVAGTAVSLVFAPGALRPTDAPGPAANQITGAIETLEPSAAGVRIRLTGDPVVAEVPASRLLNLGPSAGLAVGAPISFAVAASDVSVYASTAQGPGTNG